MTEKDCTWRSSADTEQRRPFLRDVLLFMTLSVSLFDNMVSMLECGEAAASVTECLYMMVEPSSVSRFFSELLRITALCPSFIF